MTTCYLHSGSPMRMCSLCGMSYCDDHEAEHEHTVVDCYERVLRARNSLKARLEIVEGYLYRAEQRVKAEAQKP